jgi:hypothetical protein
VTLVATILAAIVIIVASEEHGMPTDEKSRRRG